MKADDLSYGKTMKVHTNIENKTCNIFNISLRLIQTLSCSKHMWEMAIAPFVMVNHDMQSVCNALDRSAM